jgi:hypothetical protein
MKRVILACAMSVALCQCVSVRAESPCPIVQSPKEYHDLGRTLTLETSGAAAIVVGTKATEPERYAAEYLQTQIRRRFKHELRIHDEGDVLKWSTDFRR